MEETLGCSLGECSSSDNAAWPFKVFVDHSGGIDNATKKGISTYSSLSSILLDGRSGFVFEFLTGDVLQNLQWQ